MHFVLCDLVPGVGYLCSVITERVFNICTVCNREYVK